MAEGQLRCCGSSLFLKNRFGAGYNLTMVKRESPEGGQPSCDTALVSALIGRHVKGHKLLSDVGSEVTFQLPTAVSASFPALLHALDEQLDALGLEEYGISVTTMEEVFIRVAREGGNGNAQVSAATCSTDCYYRWRMFSGERCSFVLT